MTQWRLVITLLLLLAAGRALAHPASQSRLYLAIDENRVGITLQLPADQFDKALPEVSTWQTLKHFNLEKLHSYLSQHIRLSSAEHPLQLSVNSASLLTIDDEPYVGIELSMTAGDVSLSSLTLRYDAIQHFVINHRTMVFLQNDITHGQISAEPVLLDILRFGHNQVVIDRNAQEVWKGFVQIVLHGMHHILEGTDHLAFLLCLLITTGLKRRRSGWQIKPATLGDSIKLVTAFAIGHSVTLIVNALFPLPDISKWVEAAVAMSVLLAAINVIYPLFSRGHNLLAMLFGLVHGMAFASALSVNGLQWSSKLIALLGFNLGIEIIQVLLVLLLLPCVNLWRRSRAFALIRWLIGSSLAVFAGIWLFQRLLPQRVWADLIVNLSVSQTFSVILVILVISGLKYWHHRHSLQKFQWQLF